MFQISDIKKGIILASGSPRRRAYCSDLGLCFRVVAADIEEKIIADESPVAYIKRLARQKALYVGRNYPAHWIVAADTVVCLGDMVLEKPESKEDAVAMLLRLSGREHVVRTALCLYNKNQSLCDVRAVSTQVVFGDFSEDVIRSYVQSGEPMDKAGSYGIQGKGAFLVREIHGSYSNVVGLPLYEFIEMLKQYGLISS